MAHRTPFFHALHAVIHAKLFIMYTKGKLICDRGLLYNIKSYNLYMQLSYLFENDGDYALSKDVDVALWQDFRAYNNMQPVKDAIDFVIVNSQLHNEFDDFRKGQKEGRRYSYLKVNELMQFYVHHDYCQLSDSIVTQYNHTYLRMGSGDIDRLCRWIYGLRESYQLEGLRIFNTGIIIIMYSTCQ